MAGVEEGTEEVEGDESQAAAGGTRKRCDAVATNAEEGQEGEDEGTGHFVAR